MGFSKFFLIPTGAAVIVPASLISLNSNFSDELVLATYQSYIHEDIAEEAYQSYGMKTIYFENDKEAFNGFSSGAFDLAILSSSTLEEAIKKKLVKEIDWTKFTSLKQKLGNGAQNGGAGTNHEEQKKKLEEVYSPVVKQFFTHSPDLAKYGVPYFLSYLAFAYSGKDLLNGNGKEKNGNTQQKQVSWSELIQKIISDKRFKTKNGLPKLGMVEDELTLYSLSKLSNKGKTTEGAQSATNEVEKLFGSEQKNSEAEFYNQFFQINESGIRKDNLGARPLFLSPDSAVLSEMLCKGALAGAFVYNGDALYAQTMIDDEDCDSEEEEEDEDEGEDEEEAEDAVDTSDSDSEDQEEESETPKRKIKIITGSPTLWFLDSIAISAQVSPEKEAKIYDFLDKLSFEGLEKFKDHSKLNRQKILEAEEEDEEEKEEEKEKGDEEEEGEEETESENGNTWLIRNFLEIQYTPALKDFSSWIKGEKVNGQEQVAESPPESESQEDFYKDEVAFLYGDPDIEKCLDEKEKKRKKREAQQEENKCSVVYERGLSDLQNLNLTLAFERWKSNF